MASYIRDENVILTCPYNPCHKVKSSRFQVHVTNCQKLNEGETKLVCPFDAQHHVSEAEYRHHLVTCPKSDIVGRRIAKCSEEKTINLPQSSRIETFTENWDNEITPYPAPGYDPKKAERKPIFPDTTGMLPSERKCLYKSLHYANGELPPEPENKQQCERALKELRQPKMKPEVMNFRTQDMQYSSLGLGRGLPSGNRRIAANIFGVSKSQDDGMEPNSLGRGIGRGFQVNQS